MRILQSLKNFHVPLPNKTYTELKWAATQLKLPATQIARQAIESWLKEAKKQTLQREIEDYAAAMAGTSADIDPDLEAAGIELILSKKSSKKKSQQ